MLLSQECVDLSGDGLYSSQTKNKEAITLAIQILRIGSKGSDVERWQNFLIGLGHLRSTADGDFGPMTETATKAYQRSKRVTADGIVGPSTTGFALTDGFDIGFKDSTNATGDTILVGQSTLKPATDKARKRLWGEFRFEAAPTSQNREGIKILDDWKTQNIKTVMLPQLKGISVFGKRSSGKMRFHQKAAEQLSALWAGWEDAGLIKQILTYDGSYNARFIRGSNETLSSHSYGSAFDINAAWNGLGKIPALEGSEGSVRELVEIANEFGFFWGGHFKGRADGMHFEVSKLL